MYELIEENTKSPSVDRVVIEILVDHLWRHVLQRAAISLPFPFVEVALRVALDRVVDRPAEVANLNYMVVVDEQVLRLQISMNETVLVQEIDACDCLNEEPKSAVFIETLALRDLQKQVALWYVLHDEVVVLAVLEVSVEPDHVHMLQLLVDLNFSLKRLRHLWFPEVLLKEFLDCKKLARLRAQSRQEHTAIATLAQLFGLINHQIGQLHFGQGLLLIVICLVSSLEHTLLNKRRLLLHVGYLAFVKVTHQLLSSFVAFPWLFWRPKRCLFGHADAKGTLVVLRVGPGRALLRAQMLVALRSVKACKHQLNLRTIDRLWLLLLILPDLN